MADRIDTHADYLERWHQAARADALRRALAFQPLSDVDRQAIATVVVNLWYLGRMTLAAGVEALLAQGEVSPE